MDRFRGRSHSLGIRLRPVKVAGEPLKKLFDLLAFEGLVLFWDREDSDCLRSRQPHRRYCRRIHALADTESYKRFGIGGNAVAECGTIAPEANCAQHNLVLVGAAAVQDEGAMHVSVGSDNEADTYVESYLERGAAGLG